MLLPAKQSTLKLLPPHFGPGWGSFTWWVWHKKHVQWVMDVMDMALDQTCMKHQSSVDHWKILNISKKFFWPKPYRHTAPISSTAPCLMARSHSSIVTSQRFGSKFRAAEKRRMATSTATIDSSWDLQYSDTKILLGSFHWNVWYVFWIFKCNIYIYISHYLTLSHYMSHILFTTNGVSTWNNPINLHGPSMFSQPCSSWCWNFDGRNGRRGPGCVEALALGRKTRMRVSLDWFVGENLNRKPWFLPSNIGLSCKFSHHPILWDLWFMIQIVIYNLL